MPDPTRLTEIREGLANGSYFTYLELKSNQRHLVALVDTLQQERDELQASVDRRAKAYNELAEARDALLAQQARLRAVAGQMRIVAAAADDGTRLFGFTLRDLADQVDQALAEAPQP